MDVNQMAMTAMPSQFGDNIICEPNYGIRNRLADGTKSVL